MRDHTDTIGVRKHAARGGRSRRTPPGVLALVATLLLPAGASASPQASYIGSIISRRPETGQWQYRCAFGLHQIFDIGLAVLYRGDELIHIAPNKDEFPVEVDSIKSAKKNRDYYLSLGIPYQPLPALAD